MRKIRKLLCMLVVAAMLLALMSGCGFAVGKESAVSDILSGTKTKDSTKVNENDDPITAHAMPDAEDPSQSPSQEASNDAPQNIAPPEPQMLTISKDEQYKINIFLSNFSEQNFHESFLWNEETNERYLISDKFDVRTADVMELVRFAWIYANINMDNEMQLIDIENDPYGTYMGVDIDTINSVALRFFDRSISLSDVRTGPLDEYDPIGFSVIDNKVCRPAAHGETYNHMTVANQMYDLGDGTKKVDFTIYSISDMGGDDSIVLSGGIVQDKSVYYYTAEDAKANQYFDDYLSGVAVVKPYTTENGTPTYQLVSYELTAD